MPEDLTRRVRSFTIGTTISRILGLVRDQVIAYLFGAGFAADVFNAAFRIPNTFRDLFAESGLSAAFIPTFSETLTRKGKEEAFRLASNVFNGIVLIVGLLVVLGMIFSYPISHTLAMGFEKVPDKLTMTSLLTRIMFPFLLFIALAAWAMAILNTFNKFFVPAVAPAFFNIFSIAVTVISYGFLKSRGIDPIIGVAIAVTIGGLFQFLVQVPSLIRKGFKYSLYLNFGDEGFKRILKRYVPVSLGLAGSRVNFLVNLFLISFLPGQGNLSWLNYAYRIMQLPLGLFGVAVGSVALPAIAKKVTEGKLDDARLTLLESLKLVLLLTIPISIIILCLSTPIVRLVYQYGKFTPLDTSFVAQTLFLYTLGIPFASAIRVIASLFYSYHDSKTPMYASLASVAVNVILNVLLMGTLKLRAFPLALTIATFVNLSILLYFLKYKITGISILPLLRYFSIVLTASIPAGLFGFFYISFLEKEMGLAFLPRVFEVLTAGFLSLVVFYCLAQLFGLKEVKTVVKKLLT